MRLVAGLAILLSVLSFATDVSAHASLVSVEPADGSMVSQAPKTVRLQFNEPVTPAVIQLIDAEGKARHDAAVSARNNSIIITLPDDLPRGTQLISYRVVSADGHPVGGSMVFSIGMSTPKSDKPVESASGLAPLIWLTRIGVYLGLFVGVGGTFFAICIGRSRAGASAIGAALIIGLCSAAASLGFQGLDLLNLGLGDLASAAPWKAAAATSLFESLLIAGVAMAAAGIALQVRSTGIAVLLSILAIMDVGLSLAASGHAATAPPQWLTRSLVFVHGVGVAFWIGALVPLVAMLRRPAARPLPVLNRFSQMALPVVGMLVLTGLTLAIIQLQSFRALIETKYGLILSVKLVLVLGLLSLAALNRFRFVPALAADVGNTSPLIRSIRLECLVAAGILAVVAGWRFTPPPRALAVAATEPLTIHIHADNAMFQVLVSPGKVGTDSFVLQLMNGDATPLQAREARLILSLPERGIEPLERPARLGDDGYWHVADVPIPFPGRWHMRIDALVTDFREISLEDDFDATAP